MKLITYTAEVNLSCRLDDSGFKYFTVVSDSFENAMRFIEKKLEGEAFRIMSIEEKSDDTEIDFGAISREEQRIKNIPF